MEYSDITKCECHTLICPALFANPKFNALATGQCAEAVEFICCNPDLAPGSCNVASPDVEAYNRMWQQI